MDQLGSILFWDEYDVHLWLTGLGSSQTSHHITGDILAQLNAESLEEIGIAAVGQRLRILKAVYQVKLSQGVDIEPGHYIPPSELDSPLERSRHGDQDAAQTQRAAINGDRYPSSENYRGRDTGTGRSINPTPATGMTSMSHPTTSNGVITRTTSSCKTIHERLVYREPTFPGILTSALSINKKGKAHADDPVWKVLPVALKKHNITQDWRNYVMFICFGQTERCLAYDDKPHHIFKKLQEENKNPFFRA